MGYMIDALIWRGHLAAIDLPAIELPQDTFLLPLKDALFDDLAEQYGSGPGPIPEWHGLSLGVYTLARRIAETTPVTYIWADIWGGTGDQGSVVWTGPDYTEGPFQSDQIGPIDQALRILGVSAGECLDEFDALGLGRHRDTHDWSVGEPVYSTATYYRLVDQQEMERIRESGFRAFSARSSFLTMFWVTTKDPLAVARDCWNMSGAASGGIGYVTRFDIKSIFLARRCPYRTVGDGTYREYQIPAADLERLNEHIQGEIEVIAELRHT